jgi:uncharacterized protein YheU (UPF0270 family)
LPRVAHQRIPVAMTVVPHTEIQPQTLRLLIEDFVTREGAVHGHSEMELADKIAAVLNQLTAGLVTIVFDDETESCTIISKQDLPMGDASDRRIVEDWPPGTAD